jgi:hypothetical protein
VARRLKLKTAELGDLELFLIYQYGDKWESDWLPLQGQVITGLLTVATQELMDHALRGWTSPLAKSLGVPPEGAIRKLPSQLCYRRDPCPFHQKKTCIPTHPKMPWCFEPETIEDPNARSLAAELVRLWREGVYIVVVIHAAE